MDVTEQPRASDAGAPSCGDAVEDDKDSLTTNGAMSMHAASAGIPSPPVRSAETGGMCGASDLPSSGHRPYDRSSVEIDGGSAVDMDETLTQSPVRVEPGLDASPVLQSGDQSLSESGACSCPDMAGLCAMLERLASSKACFVSQQRGEKELSVSDKVQLAHGLLHRSPAAFINRFGRYCSFHDLDYLRHFRGDYQVDYQLNRLSRNLTRKDRVTTVKNRRYEAVARLETEGYFDEDEMKRRDPLLYEQMVGQYLSEEELKAEADRQMKDYRFSSWLMQQADSKETSILYHLQLQQEQQQTEEGDSDDDEDDGCSAAERVPARLRNSSARSQSLGRHAGRDDRDGNGVGAPSHRLDDNERSALREEFLHIMQERFIDGEDRDFDYRQVDDNEEYDNIELENADAEARYFDEEEPESAASSSNLASGSPPFALAGYAVGNRETAARCAADSRDTVTDISEYDY